MVAREPPGCAGAADIFGVQKRAFVGNDAGHSPCNQREAMLGLPGLRGRLTANRAADINARPQFLAPAEDDKRSRPSYKTPLTGLKAPNVTAWAEASPTSAGPGQPSHETRKP